MGIPIDFLPITMDGVLHTENHMQWLQFRIREEQVQGHLSLARLVSTEPQRVEDDNDEDAMQTL